MAASLILLGLDAAAFAWAWLPPLLGMPASNYEEIGLGVGVLSGIIGIALLGTIAALIVIRLINRRKPTWPGQ